MSLRLATLVLGCLITLAVVGVIAKLILHDIGEGDDCPYCSAALAPKVRICPRCHKALGEKVVLIALLARTGDRQRTSTLTTARLLRPSLGRRPRPKLLHPFQHFLFRDETLLVQQLHERVECEHVRVSRLLEAHCLAIRF
jgi:hypothetical protein